MAGEVTTRNARIKRAVITIELEDGSKVGYTIVQPDAAMSSTEKVTWPPREQYGDTGIDIPPEVRLSADYPVQLTLTFGFRIGRTDKFLERQISAPPSSHSRPSGRAVLGHGR